MSPTTDEKGLALVIGYHSELVWLYNYAEFGWDTEVNPQCIIDLTLDNLIVFFF